MSEKLRTVLSWSSGKDSAWALHSLRQTPDVEVVGLLTTINVEEKRVSVHSTREDLLDMQAEAADLPLQKIPLPDPCPNEVYERAMEGALGDAKAAGVEALAFGDLFLEDIRRYREESLAGTGMQLLFPLWGSDTRELAHKMLDSGLRAWVVCVDASALDPSFAGRAFDRQFLEDLPANVDPCGEDGEFHTFTFDGPMFRTPIPVQPGDIAERGGFVFADVSAAEGASSTSQPTLQLALLPFSYQRSDFARSATMLGSSATPVAVPFGAARPPRRMRACCAIRGSQ